MILVDTNVWVRSMQPKNPEIAQTMRELTKSDRVAAHEFIQGELMLGKSGNIRPQVLQAYTHLRFVETVPHRTVMDFIKKHKLENRGIGYVDAHLLAAAHANQIKLWTLEKALLQATRDLGVSFDI